MATLSNDTELKSLFGPLGKSLSQIQERQSDIPDIIKNIFREEAGFNTEPLAHWRRFTDYRPGWSVFHGLVSHLHSSILAALVVKKECHHLYLIDSPGLLGY